MKIFILCLLIFPLIAYAEEDFGVNVPEWEDFAPKAFADVKEPRGLGKFNLTTKYWYGRRVEFENAKSECKALEANDERFNCYEVLKVKQYKLNNDYNAKIEAQMNERSAIPEMGSKTDTMLPINGYFNGMTKFMPNELH